MTASLHDDQATAAVVDATPSAVSVSLHPQGHLRAVVTAFTCQLSLQSTVKLAFYTATLSAMMMSLGIGSAAAALLVACYDASQVVASLFMAGLARRHGLSRVALCSSVMVSLGCILYGLAPWVAIAFVAECLMGAGAASSMVFTPVAFAAVCDERDHGRAGFFVAIAFTLSTVAMIFGFVFVGLVGAANWRLCFSACGLMGGAGCFFLFRHILDVPALRCAASSQESVQSTMSLTSKVRNDIRRMVLAAKNRIMCLSLLMQCGAGVAFAAVVTFLPAYCEIRFPEHKTDSPFLGAASVPAASIAMLLSGALMKHCVVTVRRLFCWCAVSFVVNIVVTFTTFSGNFSFGWFFVNATVWVFCAAMSIVPCIALPGYLFRDPDSTTNIPDADRTEVIVTPTDVVNATTGKGTDSETLERASVLSPVTISADTNLCASAADALSLQNSIIRVFGSIPGPLLLGALLDRCKGDADAAGLAFTAVGCGGLTTACIASLVSIVLLSR